ncbi:MAG: hypothetical protein JNL97_09590, partial [Verrucomicrobiales bacterium]|nr:hypothetical protein [Verrucomicrobiales bacterium]
MPAFFAFTLAFGAALLFVVQPLAARAALPVLGGSPAVWNTAMVFFQAIVLAGYGAAHFVARRLPPKTQGFFFVGAAIAGCCVLPPASGTAAVAPPENPVLWLVGHLTSRLALPCFALALTSPLLQHWYARISRDRGEPYALYAASNAGSLGALLAYPLLLEPTLDLDRQGNLWSFAYVAWGLAIAVVAFRQAARPDLPEAPPRDAAAHDTSGVDWPRTLGWVALAAVPASLLQGCTLFLTT